MTSKQYKTVKLVLTALVAIVFGQAFVLENYLIPIIVLAFSLSLLIFLKGKVTEVLADERDYALGGKSALLAMQIYSWIAVISMIVLYGFHDFNPFYKPIAMTLAYSTCVLILIHSLIFRFYDKIEFSKKKAFYSILIALISIVIVFVSIRLFSGEDNWVCQNGEWVMHGHPSFPAPTVECK